MAGLKEKNTNWSLLFITLIAIVFCSGGKAQIITTIAGTNTGGFSGDGGQATAAELVAPSYSVFDNTGNLFFSDNNQVRKITSCTSSIISLTVTAIDSVICAGQTTTLTASGATNYVWNTGATTATIIVTPTITTNYIVTSTDSLGCSISDTTTIVVNPIPTITIHKSSSSLCIGNGLVAADTLIASGATTYTWSAGATTATITPSPTVTTTYTVTGTNNNCTNTDTIRITVDSVPNVKAHLTSTFTPICTRDSIILKGTGANTYTWTSVSYTFTPADSIINGVKFTPLQVGLDTFIVKGKDTITGCINKDTITVLIKPSPNIMVTPNSGTICPGGSVTFAATGAISYTWSPTTSLVFSNDSVATASPTVSTSYLVSGTAPNGCTSGNLATVIIPQDSIVVNSAVICLSNSVTLNASSIAVSYTWSPATGLSGTSGSSVIASPRNTAIYIVEGTDAFGCTGINTATVTVDSLPIISISKTPTITCSGQPVVLTASGASTYTWSTGIVAATNTVSPTANTEYTVVGTDTNGCSNTATQILLVNPLPPVAINSGATSAVINLGQSITLNASGALTYSWTSGNTNCDSCASNTESPVTNTQYCVAGKNINACRDSACINVVVDKVCDVFIPDAFSPNGDGQNDEFKVYGNCLTELTLEVFDRWGNQVYKGDDLSSAWDGTYQGKLMNTGTYIYQVQYTLNTGKKAKAKGNFSLMR